MMASKNCLSFLMLFVVAAFCLLALFCNTVGAIKCYLQPSIDDDAYEEAKKSGDVEKVKKLTQDAVSKRTEPDCKDKLFDACLLATKCTAVEMKLHGVEMFDYRRCISSSHMNICTNATFDGNTGNEACKGGCTYCYTDLCNGGDDNVVISKGSRGSAPMALVLIGTIISMVVGDAGLKS